MKNYTFLVSIKNVKESINITIKAYSEREARLLLNNIEHIYESPMITDIKD